MSVSYLDCFGLQFETVERVDGLVGIVGIHVVYEAIAQTLACNCTNENALENDALMLIFTKTKSCAHL